MTKCSSIHPTAIVDAHAELADDVVVGPYCVVGAGVRVGRGTELLSHVVVTGIVTLGECNVIHPFAVLGGEPQIRKNAKANSTEQRSLTIGDNNVIRESVTVNLSTSERATTIGSHNLLMAGCHVAHDVVMGSHCVVANGVQLAGHVVVENWVTFGGLSGVAQLRRVGQSAFVAAGAMCERNVPPFVIVQGDRARVRALNVVGLTRRGVPHASIAQLKKAFSYAFMRKNTSLSAAARELDRSDAYVDALVCALLGEGNE
ncbi:MAG: acyl-ACP--UDP-N-acetylglucosamine O-acyltransferase [Polyangiaceae bacterium]|nr:acyl-ACP--UDP-N-acetylglucosamine O-acyltransferase [Polyangiaceae bacterium]